MSQNAKPAAEIRLGSIKAAVWRNESEAGIRFNTTFSRLYRDGEQWNTTESFGRDDLLLLAKVADQAHSWIFAQVRENGATSPGGNGNGPRPADRVPQRPRA